LETAILIVWWIGLIGALIATLVIVKEVFLVINALQDILKLAELTRHAARGLVHNLQSVEQLAGVEPAARSLHQAMDHLATHAAAVAQKLDTIVEARGGPG
jgi:hypothetical protein